MSQYQHLLIGQLYAELGLPVGKGVGFEMHKSLNNEAQSFFLENGKDLTSNKIDTTRAGLCAERFLEEHGRGERFWPQEPRGRLVWQEDHEK